MTLQKRSLGRSEIRVVPWCFGGNVFGWTADEKTSFDLLDAFVDAGFDFIDTADVYSSWVPGHTGGESETVIGNWLASRKIRDRVVIATKLGMGQPGRDARLDRTYIAESIEGSLKRLRTDYVDLYQSHRDDEATPQEETLQAYADLIKAGKVRVIGASNFSATRFGSALETSAKHGLPRYETLQPQYNLADRAGFESELKPLCLAEGIGVIPYYALGAGFLTGKYRTEADFGKSPRGGGMSAVSERPRSRHPSGSGCRLGSSRGRARRGRDGLADGAADHCGADCERDLARAVPNDRGRGRIGAVGGRSRHPRSGRCVIGYGGTSDLAT